MNLYWVELRDEVGDTEFGWWQPGAIVAAETRGKARALFINWLDRAGVYVEFTEPLTIHIQAKAVGLAAGVHEELTIDDDCPGVFETVEVDDFLDILTGAWLPFDVMEAEWQREHPDLALTRLR